MHAIGCADVRRLLVGLIVICLCGGAGCDSGGGTAAPLAPSKVEQHRKTTSEYMKGMKNRGRPEARDGPDRKP